MRILPLSDEAIQLAAEAIRAGLLAAFPTETVYGLGGDGFNPSALARIFEAKGRPRFDPLIIHIADWEGLDRVADLEALGSENRERLEKLGAAFWPGPLTLILPKRPEVPDLATSGLPTVAVRLPAHPAARELVRCSTGAVAAPSANPFGRLSPTRAEHVRDGLGEKVDIILDGGRCGVGLESTVLDLSGPPRLLRPGGVPRERIEALIGPVGADLTAGPPAGEGTGGIPGPEARPRAPGQLSSHYAPRTRLSLHSPAEMIRLPPQAGEGYLFFANASRDAWRSSSREGPGQTGARDDKQTARVWVLSPGGAPSEAAANLFEALHEMDRAGFARIHAEEAPPEGLGAAINDRLRRAAATG